MESCCPARRASRERGPSYRRFGSVLMVNGSVDCPDLLRDAGLAGRAGRWAPSSLFPRSYNVVPTTHSHSYHTCPSTLSIWSQTVFTSVFSSPAFGLLAPPSWTSRRSLVSSGVPLHSTRLSHSLGILEFQLSRNWARPLCYHDSLCSTRVMMGLPRWGAQVVEPGYCPPGATPIKRMPFTAYRRYRPSARHQECFVLHECSRQRMEQSWTARFYVQ